MAACTSLAAPSMSRDRSNWRVTLVDPWELAEVISVNPAMRPNWRSKGAATVVAMVMGSAPGNWACTEMVGKSTWGSGATGSSRKAMAPARTSATVNKVVPTGRRMHSSGRLMPGQPPPARRHRPGRAGRPAGRKRDR